MEAALDDDFQDELLDDSLKLRMMHFNNIQEAKDYIDNYKSDIESMIIAYKPFDQKAVNYFTFGPTKDIQFIVSYLFSDF